jgi:hypothetical protein
MTKVTIDEITYSVTVAEENVNVTVADATETIQIQIASGASDTQVISSGGGNSLVVGSTGGLTTLKSLSAGDNVTFSDDGNTITISSTEDDLSNNTTDDLAEGTTNLYFSDARVDTALGSVTGHIIPSQTDTYDLGSPTNVWRDLYLGPNSLYVDGQQIVSSDEGTIDITTDAGQNLRISSGGTLDLDSTGDVTRLLDPSITLGNGSSTVNISGTLQSPTTHIGELELSETLFNSTTPNQNLEIRTNGTSYIHANTADFYVGPLTGAVKIDENSISTTDATQLIIEGFTNSADMTTAINTAETNANDYTDTREIAITSAYQTYADQAEADAITTSNSYADTAISNLVDSAPATLDTLNELAAALGDDANFSTTVTNSIATKWTQDNTKISNWDTAYSWGDHSLEGYLTSYTETDPVFTASPANGITATNISNWNTAYGWGDHSTEGYITDYTVTESDVTAHQAALSITESQISDLTHYTDADARTAVSLTTSNANELSYDNTTGVFTYVSPSTVAATGQVVFDVRNASGVDIARGDAVYIAGHSGGKVLVAKADANATGEHPAFGLANSAMTNNSDGTVLTHGEMLNVDTSAFAVGDTLYLSETAGELTATRPSSSATAVQNIGKVARSDNNNGIIIVAGSGRENDVPNLASGTVFIGNGTGYDKRALTTADVSEGANLYYTDARVQSVIDTNTAGFITTYDPTEADITEHQAALSITESQISDLTHYTNAQAISAVQGEATLDLTGDVTIAQDLDVTGLIKVNDGFTLSSFDPYGPAGLPSTAMPTTIMGIGQEEGWAGLTVRSRGEHDWGLSGFGIPAERPRALLTLSGGRLDGSSDDYLNTNDNFGSILFNPYSGYKTGTEWLTPSAYVEAIATEDHSSSGMGTKLTISTTENGNQAGATDPQHTNATIEIQGTTISTSDTLRLDDDVEITGTLTVEGSASTKSTIIGDYTSAGYDFHGMKLDGGDTAWAGIVFKEFDGANKPIANFTNPGFQTEVFGGTPSSPAPLGSDRRLLAINGSAGYDNTTTAPPISNVRMIGVTTETQSTSARGAKWQLFTTPNGGTSPQNTLEVRNGDTIVINADGDGKITTGGDLILDDDVEVTGTLDVDGNTTLNGNVTLGDANTDVVTSTGKLKASNGFNFTVLDTATANYLGSVLQIVETGDAAYISDGDSGSPCIGVWSGSSWKRIALGSDISSS